MLAGHRDGVEGEISQEISRSNTFPTNGVLVPNSVLTRDLSAGGTSQLISQNVRGPTIIDALRPLSPVLAAGVEVLEYQQLVIFSSLENS